MGWWGKFAFSASISLCHGNGTRYFVTLLYNVNWVSKVSICVSSNDLQTSLTLKGGTQGTRFLQRAVSVITATSISYGVTLFFFTLRTKLSGAMYCNRSCLWVCLFVCVFVGLLPR